MDPVGADDNVSCGQPGRGAVRIDPHPVAIHRHPCDTGSVAEADAAGGNVVEGGQSSAFHVRAQEAEDLAAREPGELVVVEAGLDPLLGVNVLGGLHRVGHPG